MDAETIIVGAGPAGLACGAMLRQRGRGFILLEASENIGASWRRHYDRLHLHTHKMHSGLPGKPMPETYPKYPSRVQVVEYLEDYAASNGLDVCCGTPVTEIRKDEHWRIVSGDSVFEAENVIVATGLARSPVQPTWDGQDRFAGQIIHSSEYTNAAALNADRVLVVGFGNSAGEIALDCAEAGLDVGLSVRSPVNVIPREMFGLPAVSVAIVQQFLPHRLMDAVNARFLHRRFGDIEEFGLHWSKQGPLTTIIEKGRTPLIDIGTMERIADGGITVFGALSHFDDMRAYFADGRGEAFDAVVLATGFRPAVDKIIPDWEEGFQGEDHPPRGKLHVNGDGLHFCGFNVVPTGHLRQIGKEARAIAAAIARA